MSTNIYSNQGHVAVLTGEGLPTLIYFAAAGAVPTSALALITSVQGENVGGHQFMHTLNNFIYLYVFGERIGTLVVGAKLLTRPCVEATGDGITAGSNFYATNRISATVAGMAPKVMFGWSGVGLVINGFLVKYEAKIQDPDSPFLDVSFTVKTIHS